MLLLLRRGATSDLRGIIGSILLVLTSRLARLLLLAVAAAAAGDYFRVDVVVGDPGV